VPAFLSIDPISNIERTILKLDSLPFTVGEKRDGFLVDERHIAQIERQLMPGCLDAKHLLDLLDVLRLHPADESEHHVTVG
jgi:hypothetical protein